MCVRSTDSVSQLVPRDGYILLVVFSGAEWQLRWAQGLPLPFTHLLLAIAGGAFPFPPGSWADKSRK